MSAESLKVLAKLKTTVRSYFPDAPLEIIDRAFAFSEKAHEKQKRSSGDPYIIHPTEVALSLAEMNLDIATIITGLLHDTVEDTGVTLEEIQVNFGKDVAELVDGVTKLSKITFRTTEEKQAENFRKMIIAMAKDIRVILVKLADRLNNMRTLKYLAPEKQQRIAQETLDIYAPIANRLGIGWLKIELEDLCLRYLHPDVYTKLGELVAKKKAVRDKFIESFTELLKERLEEYEIKAQISGRAKHFFSIYKKMDRRKVDFDQIHDLIAFRIVVDNITECYKSLGVIHAAFKPVPGRFKDYIAMPKANSYQSLHTTVIAEGGDRIEIQIRTQEMNSVADSGIAAHWKYKEGRFVAKTTGGKSNENVEWVNRLLEWNKDLSDPAEFLETVKIDLFAEDVFVFTPKGEVKELPYGATPLDFAYCVHTNVGNMCVGAKVNGKIVPLKYRLKSGDTIEVITNPQGQPSKDWLKIVKTSRAKAKIRAVIKQQERDRALQIGKDLLEKALKPFGLSQSKIEKSGDFDRLWKDHLSLRSPDELFIGLGYGRIYPERAIEFIVPKDAQEKKLELAKGADETFLKKVLNAAKRKTESKNAILVADLDDILIRFGRCCSPLPGDSIVGFITRGRGVTVHTSTCTKAIDSDQARRVDVQWNRGTVSTGLRRQVRIRILCLDQPGLLAVMSQTISACSVNISSANIRTTKDKKAIAVFDVEVADIQQLTKVTSALEGKKGVISVERVKS
ncbi:MAG: bifunctional (p)ppGpp synthetase/guanosine-3',5'-bis(diphosphate) 3'-pyrophosphohydrolase [Cryobacterium sp.]|nr:bifunctional (p)ppGpp synthetase/guanosine-3',5'-bis(diphosphate) 3'-pyrophosphohydrolase [Oligoflexia bacterium]